MCDYLQSIFSEIYAEDGLAVIARGMAMNKIISKFIQLYTLPTVSISSSDSNSSSSRISNERKLVLVINANKDSQLLRRSLLSEGFFPEDIPKIITNEITALSRSLLYLSGGCYIVTSRILIVDLLRENIDPSKICGFIICNAHQVSEVSIEAFILNVFRQKNKTGFIKAFSDQPEALISEFGKLEKVLRSLYLKRVYLYPRFHDVIITALEAYPPEVIELSISLTTDMKEVQTAIIMAMEGCLSELKKGLMHVDADVLKVENALFKNFNFSIKSQLESEWHRISPRLRQFIEDINTLRKLSENLLHYDAVTFYSGLIALQSASVHQYTPSMWLTSKAADLLFTKSRERVYIMSKILREDKKMDEDTIDQCTVEHIENFFDINIEIKPKHEVPPKWQELTAVMKEINDEVNSRKGMNEFLSGTSYDLGLHRVLILVKDERMLIQLKDILIQGAKYVVDKRFRFFVSLQCATIRRRLYALRKKQIVPTIPGVAKRIGAGNNFMELGASEKELREMSQENLLMLLLEKRFSQSKDDAIQNGFLDEFIVSDDEVDVTVENDKETTTMSTTRFHSKRPRQEEVDALAYDDDLLHSQKSHVSIVLDGLQIFLMTIQQAQTVHDIYDEIRPRYIVLYDPDILSIRQIEAYQLRRHQILLEQIKVYFFMYDKSTDEARYLNTLMKEKKSFEKLIHAKANMVISLPDFFRSSEEMGSDKYLTDSRSSIPRSSTGTLDIKMKAISVIVDLREFRSQLPMLLHASGLKIIPATITVGDYILSPDISVERKGITDMYQSFSSGRLYTQIEIMLRHYKFSCLLIEFSPEKPFLFQTSQEISSEIQITNICSKFVLLLLKFPNLKILWSRSPHATAELFKSLKVGRQDADVDAAMSLGNKSVFVDEDSLDSTADAEAASAAARDILLSLPGIEPQNYKTVMKHASSIAELSRLGVHKLTPLIGPTNAKKLSDFFSRRI